MLNVKFFGCLFNSFRSEHRTVKTCSVKNILYKQTQTILKSNFLYYLLIVFN